MINDFILYLLHRMHLCMYCIPYIRIWMAERQRSVCPMSISCNIGCILHTIFWALAIDMYIVYGPKIFQRDCIPPADRRGAIYRNYVSLERWESPVYIRRSFNAVACKMADLRYMTIRVILLSGKDPRPLAFEAYVILSTVRNSVRRVLFGFLRTFFLLLKNEMKVRFVDLFFALLNF